MKKYLLKSFSLIFATMMCISLIPSAFAQEISDSSEFTPYTYIEEEQLEMYVDELNRRDDGYHYETVQGPVKRTTVSGYAGNQLPGGYCFPNGGSLIYSTEGGPNVSGSITFSDPYGILSFTMNLGSCGGVTSQIVHIPADNNYYKVYVTRTIDVYPYIIYRYPYPGAPTGTVYYRGTGVIAIKELAVPVRV